jgi:hypothetical protein
LFSICVYVPACYGGAAVGEVDVAGVLVDVDAIEVIERDAVGLRGEHVGLATPRPNPHQALVGVGEVEDSRLEVEREPQRTPTRALRLLR